MRVPMTSVQSREMVEYQKIKGYTNRKTTFIFIKKNDEGILTNLYFSIEDVKIFNCSRIDNKEWILLNL